LPPHATHHPHPSGRDRRRAVRQRARTTCACLPGRTTPTDSSLRYYQNLSAKARPSADCFAQPGAGLKVLVSDASEVILGAGEEVQKSRGVALLRNDSALYGRHNRPSEAPPRQVLIAANNRAGSSSSVVRSSHADLGRPALFEKAGYLRKEPKRLNAYCPERYCRSL
jgi:hypothetical protein